MTIFLAILFGLLIGFVLGSLGGGGSVLVVPALVYGLAVPPSEAIVLSQAIVGIISFVAAAFHWRAGHVRIGAALSVAMIGTPGAYLGRAVCRSTSDTVVMISLAVVLLTTSILMLKKSPRPQEPAADPVSNSLPPKSWKYLAMVGLAGLSVGFLTGFLGVGGGFLIVPLLIMVVGLPVKQAIGTSLTIIGMNCASCCLPWSQTANLDWYLVLPLIGGALVSAILAARISHAIDSAKLTRGFAWLVILIGAVIMVERLNSIIGKG